MTAIHPKFFGYGSLVNLKTHAYPDATPARLTGWRRVWQQTTLRPAPFLSVEPCVNTNIDGIVATVPNGDWVALDARERAYERLDISDRLDLIYPGPTVVYRVHEENKAPQLADGMIYLSYLDTVVQGFLDVFGRSGAESFFETTDGWNTPILNDRATPIYPRHQKLSAAELDFVDQNLKSLSAQVKESE